MHSTIRLLLFLLWTWCAGSLAAAPALVLDDAERIDVWPAVGALAEPAGAAPWRIDDALRRRDEFAAPQVPRANFGPPRQPLWLRVPLDVVRGGHWVLEVDYAALNRIDVYVVDGARVVQRLRLGNDQPYTARPLKARAHAAPLELRTGAGQELLVRVQSTSSMIVPMTLFRPEAFLAEEAEQHLLQGLLFGLALMLLAYSVAHAIALRDVLFAYYAAMLLGLATFLVSYTGIGQRYLWDAQAGLLEKIAPQGALVALAAASLFVRGAIDLARRHPRTALGLRTIAVLAGVALVLSLLGVLDYRTTQQVASLLGPLPLLLALPAAAAQARRGDRAAWLLVVGWGIYALGAVCLAGMLRGYVPHDGWTRHLFQLSSMFEMLVWMRLLGLRMQDVRRDAERAQLEREALLALARTDPLTGLPNRRGLNAALAAALPQARADHVLVIYLIDLDGFKPVNDRYGHDVGDELLVQAGQRLRSQLRAADVVARLGGDEFVVMATGLAGEADAQRLGAKLLAAFAEPFDVAGQRCPVGLTIGFAMAPHDGSDGGELLKRADAAMYAGKQLERGSLRRDAASPEVTAV